MIKIYPISVQNGQKKADPIACLCEYPLTKSKTKQQIQCQTTEESLYGPNIFLCQNKRLTENLTYSSTRPLHSYPTRSSPRPLHQTLPMRILYIVVNHFTVLFQRGPELCQHCNVFPVPVYRCRRIYIYCKLWV